MKPLFRAWLVVMTVALSLEANELWVFNPQGAPMVLEGQARGGYTLKNTSGKKVVSFALGCVVLSKDRVIIKSALKTEDFSIVPKGSFGEAIADAPYTDAYSECVVKLKARLALISVTFEDGSSWSLSPAGASRKGL
jgi:hypothetical protein